MRAAAGKHEGRDSAARRASRLKALLAALPPIAAIAIAASVIISALTAPGAKISSGGPPECVVVRTELP